jgi:hypothetical protein
MKEDIALVSALAKQVLPLKLLNHALIQPLIWVISGQCTIQKRLHACFRMEHNMQYAHNLQMLPIKLLNFIDVSTVRMLQTIPPDLIGQISKALPRQIE